MKFLTCPETPNWNTSPAPKIIFMAGGITDCPDWQAEFQEELESLDIPDHWVMVNPRRPNFNVRDPSVSEEQIDWEYKWLERAAFTSFWFPKETLCPITLFELGKQLGRGKKVIVGAHVDYARRFDVEYQLDKEGLRQPESSIRSLALRVKTETL